MVNVRSRLKHAAPLPFAFGRETVDGLVALARDLGQTTDMATILSIFVQAITDVADFEHAAINLVNDDGDLVVVAVVGPSELHAALIGTVGSRAGWDREIALADRHGAVHHSLTGDTALDDVPSWVSDDESWFARTADDAKAWTPDQALFVPMFDADGDLLGVVSVDLPRSGLMPDHAQLAILEVLARQVETAISAAQTVARAALDQHLFSSLFEVAGSAMCVVDGSGRLTHINRRFRELFGTITDVGAFDLLVTQVQGGNSLTDEVRATFDQPPGERTIVVGTGIPDERSWFHVTVRGVADGGGAPARAVCTMADITGERRTQDRHHHDAEHDVLTGVLNRRGVRGAAAGVIGACRPGDFLVTMFCDLDRFKQVNHQHGHACGDQILVDVASALRKAAPEPAVLGRVGGDEFVIFASCSSILEAQKLADTIVSAVAIPLPGSTDSFVTTSVGMAMDDSQPHRTISELMQAADGALSRAKLAGGGRWTSAPIL